MQVTQREVHEGRFGGNMFTDGGTAMNNHKSRGKDISTRRLTRRASPVLIAAAAAAVMFISTAAVAAQEEEGGLLRAGNGPGPAANGPGPGCNIIPPLAAIGTNGDTSQFPPPTPRTH